MKLTLRQMEIFLNVVASGHLTNVAKEMGLSQSAISMSIKELENILGRPVFDRINKKLVLNEVGRAFHKEIDPIFKKLTDIEYEFQNSENKGMIRVGASTTIVDYLMPPIICSYMSSYPDVKISLKEGNTKEITEMIANGEIDIGFVEGFVSGVGAGPIWTPRRSRYGHRAGGHVDTLPERMWTLEHYNRRVSFL